MPPPRRGLLLLASTALAFRLTDPALGPPAAPPAFPAYARGFVGRAGDPHAAHAYRVNPGGPFSLAQPSVFRSVLHAQGAGELSIVLPEQIAVEMHYITTMDVGWAMHGSPTEEYSLSSGDMSITWAQLSDLGYVVVSREDNIMCPHCSEFVLVRAFL